jgi:hypothetical protein
MKSLRFLQAAENFATPQAGPPTASGHDVRFLTSGIIRLHRGRRDTACTRRGTPRQNVSALCRIAISLVAHRQA